MSVRDSLLTDYRIWENLEPVTLIGTSTVSENESFSIARAKRRVLTTKEMAASNGRYTGSDIMWVLPVAEMSPEYPTPKPFDVIVDGSGNRRTILEVASQVMQTRWHCTCRNLVIAELLHDTVDVEHPTISNDESLGRMTTWETVQSAVECRVQPRETIPMQDRGVSASSLVYDVYLATDIQAATSSGNWARLKWGDRYLQINRYSQASRMDVLPVAEAVIVP